MRRTVLFLITALTPAFAQVPDFKPVTQMFSRTYDAQRFSPLKQINKQNVGTLRLAWSRGLTPGTTETIPTVYRGVIYVTAPGSIIQALDATTGDLIWEYKRKYANPGIGTSGRSKTLAIFDDMIYFAAPDSYVVALDARTGAVRWETKGESDAVQE